MKSPPSNDESYELDPVFVSARRETLVIVGMFALFCAWSIFVCYRFGYAAPGAEAAPVSIVFGMPAWVFWGLFVPWIAVDLVAVWFCFFFMRDDDLGKAPEEEERESELSGKSSDASPAEGRHA